VTFPSAQTPIRILGIGGDMSDNSINRIALNVALNMAEEVGATPVLADVRDLDLPFYNPEWSPENFPGRLTDLLDEARRADAYIVCSPDYHFTVSGAVKNVLDIFSLLDPPHFLSGKPVGLMATGIAVGNVITALDHAVHALNSLSVPTFAGIPNTFIDPAKENITPGPQRDRLHQMVNEVVDLARRLRPATVLTAS
jgi:FMN reductase